MQHENFVIEKINHDFGKFLQPISLSQNNKVLYREQAILSKQKQN